MNAEQFLARVVGPGNFACIGWKDPKKNGMLHRYFPPDKLNDAASFARWASGIGADAYFGLAGFKEAEPGTDKQGRPIWTGSRKQDNAQAFRGFWLDLDVARPGDGKDPTQVYADRPTAIAWLKSFVAATGLPQANMIVDSGYGYHVYWLLDEPIIKEEWKPYADALKTMMIANGYIGDLQRVADAASVLRPPGTYNVKGGSKALVSVIGAKADIPNADMLDVIRPHLAAGATTVGADDDDALASGSPDPRFANINAPDLNAAAKIPGLDKKQEFKIIATQCEQVKRSLATGGKGDLYPLWYQGFLLLSRFCVDGDHYAHEISKGDHRYDKAKVNAALAAIDKSIANQDLGPPRCTSMDSHRPGVCQGCPHFGQITSPCSLGANSSAVTPAIPAVSLARGAPITQLPHFMTEPEAEAQLNSRICKVINYGGGPSFGLFGRDGSVTQLKPTDLPVLLSGHFVAVPDGKGGTKYVPAAVWWTQSQTKLVYDAIRYDPERRHSQPGEISLNTWRGLAVQPVKGSWRRMRRHIWKVLCGGDYKAFKYLLRWMAHLVQHPGTNPEVMVVLRSDREGVGKSSLGQWLLRILGPHGREMADTEQVFGDFNDALAGVSFVLLEEPVFPGNHKAAEMLRAMLTAQTLRINPKGRPAYDIPHNIYFMMTTNGDWAIPAGADARRFLMLDAGGVVMPRTYFDALWGEAKSGGIAAMLYDLLRVDLRQFNPRTVPATSALVEQQRRSADDMTQWINDATIAAELIPNTPGGGFNATWSSAVLHKAYLTWASAYGIRRPKNGRVFGKALGKLGLIRGAGNNPPMWTIPDEVTLLAAADKRAGIRSAGR